jgi:hypothetical protein
LLHSQISKAIREIERWRRKERKKKGSVLMKPEQKSQEALLHCYISCPVGYYTLQMHELLK